jgi:hypothetical protein
MEFLEAPAFTRYVSGYLTDDEYRELQNRLAAVLLPRRTTNLADYGLRQGRSFRPYA